MSVESTTESKDLIASSNKSFGKKVICRVMWAAIETRVLLKLWKKHIHLIKFSKDKSRRVISQTVLQNFISTAFESTGRVRSPKEVMNKMKNMRKMFRDEEEKVKISNIPSKWPYYKAMKEISILEAKLFKEIEKPKPVSVSILKPVDHTEDLVQDIVAGSSTDIPEQKSKTLESPKLVRVYFPVSRKNCNTNGEPRPSDDNDHTVNNALDSSLDHAMDKIQYEEDEDSSNDGITSDDEPASDFEDHLDISRGEEYPSSQPERTQERSGDLRRKRPPSEVLEDLLSEFRRSNVQMERHDRQFLHLLQENNEICRKQNRLLSLFYTQ